MLSFIVRLVWGVFTFLEKAYWFAWRDAQHRKLQSCGDHVWFGRGCKFVGSMIRVGNDVYIGENCRLQSLHSRIDIGNHVMFGPGVSILGGDHRFDVVGKRMKELGDDQKTSENDQDIFIEDDVWIGSMAIILKGVRIGEGSIIGAGAIITRSVPPFSIVTGCKPQQIRPRWSPEVIQRHKDLLVSEAKSTKNT